jgi:hypothetical protein
MKIRRAPHSSRGSAVVVVLALLALVLLYVDANLTSLHRLGRDLRAIERHQLKRLQTLTSQTNSPPGVSGAGPATSPIISSNPPAHD